MPRLLFMIVVICCFVKIYVIDSADRRRMEETGVELQQLLDEVLCDFDPRFLLFPLLTSFFCTI